MSLAETERARGEAAAARFVEFLGTIRESLSGLLFAGLIQAWIRVPAPVILLVFAVSLALVVVERLYWSRENG